MVDARVDWGLVAGLDPPSAGWIWQPPQESRLKRGPSPSSTASTSENCSFPWLEKNRARQKSNRRTASRRRRRRREHPDRSGLNTLQQRLRRERTSVLDDLV